MKRSKDNDPSRRARQRQVSLASSADARHHEDIEAGKRRSGKKERRKGRLTLKSFWDAIDGVERPRPRGA